MHKKHSSPPLPKRCNGFRRRPPVELLSARILRLRIARGYSADDLATAAHVFAGTIRSLESGKPADKHVLPTLAAALGVQLCQLVRGQHCCAERACVSPARDSVSEAVMLKPKKPLAVVIPFPTRIRPS
jgi:DNA-binding XRE family transcriptional regulator